MNPRAVPRGLRNVIVISHPRLMMPMRRERTAAALEKALKYRQRCGEDHSWGCEKCNALRIIYVGAGLCVRMLHVAATKVNGMRCIARPGWKRTVTRNSDRDGKRTRR